MKTSTQLTIASLVIAAALISSALVMTRSQGEQGAASPQLKEFNVVMQNSEYNPSKITVNQGDNVVITVTNKDTVAHALGLPQFGATVPGGHILPGKTVELEFTAFGKGMADGATCGGARPTDKTDAHGEELIVEVI